MAWYDFILFPIADRMAVLLSDERAKDLKHKKEYYQGKQRKMLKVKQGGADDNVILNFVGLAVERSVSMLFGGGVKFKFIDDNSEQAETLKKIWDANKKEILLHEAGLDGAWSGTIYIRTDPLGVLDPYTGDQYTELVLLDPTLMTMEADPKNIKNVIKYIMQYKVGDVVYREEYSPNTDVNPDDKKEPTWKIEYFEARGGAFKLVNTIEWNYTFAPILHCKNLPSVHSLYGVPDIDDVLNVQDAVNFIGSNIRKVIRNQAHKKLWGKGFNADTIVMGADDMPILPNEKSEINAIDDTADMTSSENHFSTMRQAIFDLARVVDISSIKDKVGALTNFGLRVLYSDALSKNATKRLLYGEFLSELNRRLLVIEGYEGEETRPPLNEWGADLPQDETEDAKLILDDLKAEIISVQTASEKRGYQWETDDHREGEADRIANQRTATGQARNEALANFMRRG